MTLPDDWKAARAAGVWPQYYLIHTACGMRSTRAIDLVFSPTVAREHIANHQCPDGL